MTTTRETLLNTAKELCQDALVCTVLDLRNATPEITENDFNETLVALAEDGSVQLSVDTALPGDGDLMVNGQHYHTVMAW